MSNDELDELFDEITSTSSPSDQAASPALRRIETHSTALSAILNDQLTDLMVDTLVNHERKKAEAHRVDGLIIGTGEADFTKGNTLYPLNYKGKRFQLIDVPGIEGEESKYAHMVREAVAKAHLVFYVNGTNKKPEKATAQKIRDYLRLGTKVCTLINVRGSADTYEFEEDRESLTGHGGSGTALEQTEEVLRNVLGEKVMQSGHCVQGLLAFSALAIDARTKRTTIDPSRESDLVIQQRNYQKHFTSLKSMYEFSQIKSVAKVLHSKLSTYREDMIESNKTKVHELLTESGESLQKLHAKHQAFVTSTKPEFEKCREAIQGAQTQFKRLVGVGQKNLWDKFFDDLKLDADEIVEEHFGKNSIPTKINSAFKSRQKSLEKDLIAHYEEHLNSLKRDLHQATERLLQDVARVEFEQLLSDTDIFNINFKSPELGLGLDLGDFGSFAFTIGSYATTGFILGSAFPGIGNAVGAAVGALVGVFFSAMTYFSSKENRIRKAQEQIHTTIEEAKSNAGKAFIDESKRLLNTISKQIDETILVVVQQLDESLERPLKIIEQQLALMDSTKKQLQEMPYGTIQSI